MIRCIAVDDEGLALDLLEDNIRRVPFLSLVKRCKNAFEALDALQHEQVDLIFLDIQMPGINGVQFLQTMKAPPMVIFITAYEKFALEGYNLDVVDYLLKPVAFERFVKASTKAYDRLNLVRTPPAGLARDFLFVQADYKLVKLNLDDILYIEGLKDYVKIFLKNEVRPVLTRMSLKSLEEKLPAVRFLRVHKSYIVAVDKIASIRKGKITILQAQVPISELYRENLYRLLGQKSLS